jgi:1-acyl-sn-glycerol-3-phosphate acyltransferase
MKTVAKIRFYLGAFIISSVVGVIMVPLLFLLPKYSCQILHYLNALIIFLLGGKIEQAGERDPDAEMLLINHQGIIDIIAMEARSCTGFRWVAKKELFEIPWFGQILKRSHMISVDRQNKAGLIKLLKEVKDTVENHPKRVVTLFPEGTRANGQKLLSFKSGAELIANRLKLKVQPVVITGSKQLLNEHNKTAHNATVKIIFLPALSVDGTDKEWYKKLSEKMQEVIDDEYETYHRER